jgi:hypothetical protein
MLCYGLLCTLLQAFEAKLDTDGSAELAGFTLDRATVAWKKTQKMVQEEKVILLCYTLYAATSLYLLLRLLNVYTLHALHMYSMFPATASYGERLLSALVAVTAGTTATVTGRQTKLQLLLC